MKIISFRALMVSALMLNASIKLHAQAAASSGSSEPGAPPSAFGQAANSLGSSAGGVGQASTAGPQNALSETRPGRTSSGRSSAAPGEATRYGGYGAYGTYPAGASAPRSAGFQSPYAVTTRDGSAPAIVCFSALDSKSIDALEEDLNIMSVLLERQLERALGKNGPNYKMGIPMLLRSGTRGVQSSYLEGFGAVFTMAVNFPLVAPPAKPPVEEPASGTDWDAARKELYGARPGHETTTWSAGSLEGPEYNSEQVASLRNALIETLKNTANIRQLKAEESIVFVVFGTESVAPRPVTDATSDSRAKEKDSEAAYEQNLRSALGLAASSRMSGAMVPTGTSSGRGTVLTIRIKKSDAVAFAIDKATINTYLGTMGQPAMSGRWPAAGAYSTVR